MSEQYICQCGERKKAVLTFDGGGMRGYSSLIYVQKLMEKCGEYERQLDVNEGLGTGDFGTPLPCTYFDYIAGTSTGGLIAVMLARLRMSVDAAKDSYETLGGNIFGRKRRLGLAWSQYDHRSLERTVKEVVKSHCRDATRRLDGGDILRDPPTNEPCCRSILYAMRRNERQGDQIHLFRSYFHPPKDSHNVTAVNLAKARNAGDDANPQIWEASRATSAAPRYFKPITIEDVAYMDGGVGVNNPSYEVWSEVRAMHTNGCTEHCRIADGFHSHVPCDAFSGGIATFVSVGTGIGAPLSMFSNGTLVQRVAKIFKKAIHEMTDPEPTHHYTQERANNAGVRYFRFNIEQGMENFKMDRCELVKAKPGIPARNTTLDQIRDITERYISNREGVNDRLIECARHLVTMRRRHCHNRRFEGYCRPGPLDAEVRRQRSPAGAVSGARPTALDSEIQPVRQRSTLPVEPRANGRPSGLGVVPSSTWPRAVAGQADQRDDLEAVMSPTANGPVTFELPHERDPQEVDIGTPRQGTLG